MPTVFNDMPERSMAEALYTQLNLLIADFKTLKAQFAAHTHGGITTGAGTSGVPTSTFTTALTDQTSPIVHKK